MGAEQLNYRHLEYLTQDALDNSLIAEACEGFLKQDTTEDGRLYAKAKLKKIQSLLSGIPDLGSLQAHKDLIALADNSNELSLKAFSRAKAIFAAADFISLSRETATPKEDLFRAIGEAIGQQVQNDGEFQRIKLEQCCQALGIALGSPVIDVRSAIEAAKNKQISEKEPVLLPFVVAAVGIANEISHTDFDDGYQIFSNISMQTPDTMYPRYSAISNRLEKYLKNNDKHAIEQAKQLVKDVIEFCDKATSNTNDSEYSRFATDVVKRKKEALRVAMNNITMFIESLENSTTMKNMEMINTGIIDIIGYSAKNARGCRIYRLSRAIEQAFAA